MGRQNNGTGVQWDGRTMGQGAMGQLVSSCFEPSQPLGVTSGLNTTFNQSLSYSAHKSLNIDHNISTAQLFEKAESCWEDLWNEI